MYTSVIMISTTYNHVVVGVWSGCYAAVGISDYEVLEGSHSATASDGSDHHEVNVLTGDGEGTIVFPLRGRVEVAVIIHTATITLKHKRRIQ